MLHSADAAFRTLRAWVFYARFRALLEKRPDGFKQSLKDNILLGADLTGSDVARAYQQLTSIHDRMRAFFETLRRPGAPRQPGAAVQRRPGVPRRRSTASPRRPTSTGCGRRTSSPSPAAPRSPCRPASRPRAGRSGSSWSDRCAASGGCSRSRTPSSRPPASATAARRSARRVTRRIRIGIDTGGTFTDVVAVDEETGELAVTKTPSTPADPAVGLHDRRAQGPRRARPRRRRGERGQPRHDRRHQQAARGQGARTSGSSPPRATSSSWRSPGSRSPTATATPTSG